jgi:hypothetical protein
MIRRRRLRVTRGLAIELLFAGIAIAFVLAIPKSSAPIEAVDADPGSNRLDLPAHAKNVKIKQFMERVALSYVATPRIPDASVMSEGVDPSRPTVSAREGRR